MNTQFSFIIITYNEEQHLPRLLDSIAGLNAATFILDSGSTDDTISIAQQYGAVTLQHAFENHPKQWGYALNNFDIQTPWIICLDADQIVTEGLKTRLADFKDEDHQQVNGIYFNRKNFFKGRWIKHGGYSPFYLLKMIRYGNGYSDLNENMDHRFIVLGKTEVWKDGYILEENLKENQISFWINKHNRYSDLVAQEEVERMLKMRSQTLKPRFWGSPDERTAWLKQLWWKMPLYSRPLVYLIYRMFFRLGILDGRTGVIFHFLQAFWFRLIVDIKIDEILLAKKKASPPAPKEDSPVRFVIWFLVLFVFFYYFNAAFFGITQPGARHYNAWIADNLNYISVLRTGLIKSSAQVLGWMGFSVITNESDLLVVGRGVIRIAYDCLGLGVISFFAAFVIAYPQKRKSKVVFLIAGIVGIELLNIIRFVVLALFWDKQHDRILDHHTIFNIFIYLVIAVVLFFWIKQDEGINKQ
ncbi:exosortase Y [Mucilaginibacter sp. X4EP1]|uniref:exosortase Y n=1 Tax=Mucilaginibacter sp. X4EP1 TaxID=2723092 RepID=UPI002167E3D0|nr:glycosyltransferase [Mucilaginibacter sp. X4EP1]MCS3811698.1 exosortase/archaeosortase family protein [Mucilaginibacter sp. X4EP1]